MVDRRSFLRGETLGRGVDDPAGDNDDDATVRVVASGTELVGRLVDRVTGGVE